MASAAPVRKLELYNTDKRKIVEQREHRRASLNQITEYVDAACNSLADLAAANTITTEEFQEVSKPLIQAAERLRKM